MRSPLVVQVFTLILFFGLCPSLWAFEEHGAQQQPSKMIAVEVKVIEILSNDLTKAGLELTKFNGKGIETTSEFPAFAEISNQAMVGFVDALLKNNLARVLANPRIITLSGRSASAEAITPIKSASVSNVAVAHGHETIEIGTELQVLPVQTSENKITLDVNMRWSGVTNDTTDDKQTDLRRYQVDTSIETQSGNSVLLTGLRQSQMKDGKKEEVLCLFIVTPELIDHPSTGRNSSTSLPVR